MCLADFSGMIGNEMLTANLSRPMLGQYWLQQILAATESPMTAIPSLSF